MITPAFNITATERVLPRLALDFTTAALDARVTVTRALNTATRFNNSGYVETVNANLPRFDYDPLTLQCRGLLIEETRQNLLLQSKTFSSTWSIGTSVLLTAAAAISPDGTQNAFKLIENTNTGGHQLVQSVTTTATATAYGVFAKRGERNWIALGITDSGSTVRISYFDLLNGVKGTTATGVTSSITSVGNGWYWCVCVVGTALAGSNNARIYVTTADNTTSYTGDGTSGLYIWQADLQPGAFMTSPIFTTTTSLTRNADVVSMTGTNFSNWYNATEGAFVIKFSPATDAAKFPVSVSDGTNNNRMQIMSWSSRQGQIVNGNVDQALFDNGSVIPQSFNTVCMAYKLNNSALSIGGAVPATDPGCTIPSVDRLFFGNATSGGDVINGHIAEFNYFPQRLINNEVRAFAV